MAVRNDSEQHVNNKRVSWAVVAGLTPLLLAGAIALGLWVPRQFGASTHSGAVELSSMAPETAEGYRFVEAHQELATRLPCYCGCGPSQSHQSLLDCYIEPTGYSDHAIGCLVCGRIAREAEDLFAAGEDVATIRARVDGQYAEFGPPTNTP